MTAHARLNASSAHRWMACPGSVRQSEGEENVSSKFADEGAAAHALAARYLTEPGFHPWIGEYTDEKDVFVTEEMVDAVKVFVEYCNGIAAPPDLRWIERQFNLSALKPPADMFGTADFVAIDPTAGVLHVVDLKYGKGVVVEVTNNKQLRYYALGALLSVREGCKACEHLHIRTVRMTIVQPRVMHADGPIRSEEISVADLVDFSEDLLEAARATQEPDAPLIVGKHCRFCPAMATCPAQRNHAQALAQIEFAELPTIGPPNPETLPLDVLADILSKAYILEDWLGAARARAQRMLERGEVTEEHLGQKLVARRAVRRWVNVDDVQDWLLKRGFGADDIFESKFKSPAQVEKLLGRAKKEIPAALIEKKSSGHTMVPLHDVRPAIAMNPGDEFFAISSGETSQEGDENA